MAILTKTMTSSQSPTFDCHNCEKVITAGWQCAIRTYDGNLYFTPAANYCSKTCLLKYVGEPHIYWSEYVEHYYSQQLEEWPQPHQEEKQQAMLRKHRSKFEGAVPVPEKIRFENQGLDAASDFLLGLGRRG